MKTKTMLAALGAAVIAWGAWGEDYAGYKLKIVTESKDVDAFEDGSFESTKRGRISDNAEVGSFGVNGGSGLKVTPKNKTIYYRFKLKPNRLVKGNRYVYSADVKARGNVGAVIALDTMFKATHKSAPGCSAWGTCFAKGPDGFSHQTDEFVAKHDQDLLDYQFIVYGRADNADLKNPETGVYVDNIKIELVAPKWLLSNTWPAYNLLHKDEGRIRFNSTFVGEYLEKDSEAVYGCRLTACACPDGVCPLPREVFVRPDGKGNFTADFGKLDFEGPAKIAVTLYDRTHKLNRGTREFSVTVKTPDRAKGLFAQEDGVVLKDGKPFMPLGFYTGLANPEKHDMKSVEYHMKRLHEAGFDTIMDYSSYTLKGARRDQFYALAEKYGIFVIDDSFNRHSPTTGPGREASVRMAKEIAAHPAHIGWYTMDEAPEDAVPHLAEVRRLLNEVAPGKFVNTCNIMKAAPYLPTADAQGGDSYPVKKGSGGTLQDPYGRTRAVADCRPAAIWYAPQCYNWARMIKGHHDPKVYIEQGREPTFMEMLSVALAMVVNDTTGFLFYSYFELIENPVAEYREQRWSDMVRIAKEMRLLEPFIMSGAKKIDIPCTDKKEETHAVALTDAKGRRVVLVLGLCNDHETTFRLPAEWGAFKSRFGYTTEKDGTWTFRAKAFVCDVLEMKEATKLSVSFARGAWDRGDWSLLRSPRWKYLHGFEQLDDGIANETPGTRTIDWYSAMTHNRRFGLGDTVTVRMSFDNRFAPGIVIAPDVPAAADGVKELRDHFEIIFFDGGLNVWQYRYADGKFTITKPAYLETKFENGTPRDVSVFIKECNVIGGGKTRQMTVTCGEHVFGFRSDDIPASYYVGINANEGRCRFHFLEVK